MKKIEPFHLERYFARHEFSARYLLSSSDCQALEMREVLSWADDETRAAWERLALGYTESQGLPRLREEVAKLYHGVGPDDVLEVVPEEGILIAMTTLLEPTDHVVATWPGYQSLYSVAEAIGCEVSRWEPVQDEGWRFAPESLRRLLRPNTRLIVMNFPHNPTGFLPSRADFEAVMSLAEGAGIRVFCDEMYRFLEQDESLRLPSGVERSDRAVVLGGMSKAFSLAGLRVGWLVTRDAELRSRMAEYKDYTTICGSAPSEILALIALRSRQRILERNLDLIARNLACIEGFVERWQGRFSWVRPRAGSIGLLGLEGAHGFCERLVRETGVMLLPSSVYGYGDAHVRLGFGRANFAEGLAVLEEWLSRA